MMALLHSAVEVADREAKRPDSGHDGLLQRMVAGEGTEGDIDTMLDVCDNILGRAFCALGDGATSPITSAIEYFRDEFVAGTHTPSWELFPPERSTLWADQVAGAGV